MMRQRILDNPLVGRQLATHLTGVRLAVVFFFLTGALLLADVITFSTVLLALPMGLVAEEAGRILWSVNSLVLLGTLIITIPARLAGAIDGLRLDRVFDQVVVTGVSPLRIHFGNWTLAFLYTLGVLCVSLPFQVYAILLGGVSWEHLLGGYGILALYANLIIAVALGFSTFEREWLGVPVTIAIFLGLGLLCLAPVPSEFGLSTPVRYFLRPLAESRSMLRYWDVDPVFYLWTIPPGVYAPLLWLCLAAPNLVLVLLGPSHRFQPGLNNFGNVVLPGDRKRRFFRKARFTLTRRVELAFFYENRPRWLKGLDYPLRALWAVGGVLLAFGLIVGLAFRGGPHLRDRLELANDPNWVIMILATAVVLFVAVLLFGDAGSRRGWREQIGPWQIPRGILQGACVLILLGVYLAMHRHIVATGLAAHVAGPSSPADWDTKLALFSRDHWELVLATALFLCNWFLLGRLLATVVSSQVALRLILILAGGAVLCGPLILAVGMEERWLSRDSFAVLFLTPISVFLARVDSRSSFGRLGPAGFDADQAFGLFLRWHGTLAVAIVGMLFLVFIVRLWLQLAQKKKLRASAVPTVLLLGALFAWQGLSAQESSLPLEARLIYGFDGRLFKEGFVSSADFFTLTVKNKSSTELRAELRLELPDDSVVWSRPLVIPAGTTLPVRWVERSNPGRFGNIAGAAGSRLVIDVAGQVANLPLPAPLHLQRNASNESRFHLFVDETGVVDPSTSSLPRGQSGKDQWAVATSFCLPEEACAYWPLDGVYLQQPDFSRWTSGQRRALYDYLRLGGCVVVSGALDPSRLKGIDEWEGLLKSRQSFRSSVEGVELAVESLEDSSVTSAIAGEAGKGAWGDSLQLLCVRPLGLGRLCHLSVDPSGPHLEQKTWDELWGEVMPHGDFPEGLFSPFASDLELRDSTSLFVVLGYFVAYSCVLGPLGFFVLRRRARRKWLPVWIIGLPLLFVALLPVLHASLHLRPSYASLTRVALFGAGARRGVTYARLQVRSSGRQDHALALNGVALAGFSGGMETKDPYGGFPSSGLVPLPLLRRAGSEATLSLRTPPWGAVQLLCVGDVEQAQPVSGRATVIKSSQMLELSVTGLELKQVASVGFVLLRLAGEPRFSRAIPVELEALRRGALRLNYSSDSVAGRLAQALALDTSELGRSLLSGLPERDGIYLGWESADVNLSVQSSDLAFERELAEAYAITAGTFGERRHVTERGGKLYRSLARSVVVVELPLEVK